jgi:hypothetical protein
MRNVALVGRRELEAHRRSVSGVTASLPGYAVVDAAGHEEWVVDVYLGPIEGPEKNILRNVPIAPYARHLIGGLRQPVMLHRSPQGKYTVIGREKEMPAGAQSEEGSILEPTYHEISVNLADLGLLWIPDLDWSMDGWGTRAWGEDWRYHARDAWGRAIMGDGADGDVPPVLSPDPIETVVTRHLLISLKSWGPAGHPDAFAWGVDPWGAPVQRVIEHEE